VISNLELGEPAQNCNFSIGFTTLRQPDRTVGWASGMRVARGGGVLRVSCGVLRLALALGAIVVACRSLASMLTPRHGAVAGTIAGVVYVAGGGPQTGASFSAVNEAFRF
jgi:hypothetical protein